MIVGVVSTGPPGVLIVGVKGRVFNRLGVVVLGVLTRVGVFGVKVPPLEKGEVLVGVVVIRVGVLLRGETRVGNVGRDLV